MNYIPLTIRQLMKKFPDNIDTPIHINVENWCGSPEIGEDLYLESDENRYVNNNYYDRHYGTGTVIRIG